MSRLRCSGQVRAPGFAVLSGIAFLVVACSPPKVSGGGAGGSGSGAGGAAAAPGGGTGGAAGGPGGGSGGGGGSSGPTDGPGFGNFRDVASGPPPEEGTCASDTHQAMRVPVDLYLLVDVSTSMLNPIAGGTQTKWQVANDALLAFLRDPMSAGLNIAMSFFPLGASCDLAEYSRPAVPFTELPAGITPLSTALAGAKLAPGTPTGVAVNGALAQIRARLAAQPTHKGILLLVTDGEPTACTPLFIPEIAMPIGAAFGMSPSIQTYVIAVLTAAELARARDTVHVLAMAGGTTAFVLDSNIDLPRRLAEALSTVRSVAVACEYTIPPPRGMPLDFAKVNVRFKKTTGMEDIPYVQSAARCDPVRGGWYYDKDPATGATPTRVIVCDNTCRAFKADPNARVDLVFGCKTVVID